MSLLWRDEIRIFVGPQQIDLVRCTGLGARKIIDVRAISFLAKKSDVEPWHTALEALESLLAEFHDCKANVVVMLSNHFMRYVLVQHGSETNSADEEKALIHHYFANIYGHAADQWEYRLSDSNQGSQVASAVSPLLTASLDALFKPTKMTLRSVQPHLMTAFNSWRKDIGESAWFAIVEPGMLCLARFDRNQWRYLRMINSGENWMEDLAVNILRAKVMAEDVELASDIPVYVFAPGHSKAQWTHLEGRAKDLLGTCPMQMLNSPQLTIDGSSTVPLFAMALAG